MESQIYRLVELLNEQRLATLDNVRRKQAKAGEENEDDEDADGGAISDDDSDHEEDGMIYNPKNLPLGWDGKVKTIRTSPSIILLLLLRLANSLLVVQTTRTEYVFQL